MVKFFKGNYAGCGLTDLGKKMKRLSGIVFGIGGALFVTGALTLGKDGK